MTADKQTLTTRLLQRGDVIISIDPRRLGVMVPDYYKQRHQLDLRIAGGGDMRVVVSRHGILGTCYAADGRPMSANIAWHALYAIAADNDPTSGKVWTADFPPELKAKFAALNDRGPVKCGPEKRQRAVSTKVAKVYELATYRARKAVSK